MGLIDILPIAEAPRCRNEQFSAVIEKFRDVENFNEPMFFYGGGGTGKTYVKECFIEYLKVNEEELINDEIIENDFQIIDMSLLLIGGNRNLYEYIAEALNVQEKTSFELNEHFKDEKYLKKRKYLFFLNEIDLIKPLILNSFFEWCSYSHFFFVGIGRHVISTKTQNVFTNIVFPPYSAQNLIDIAEGILNNEQKDFFILKKKNMLHFICQKIANVGSLQRLIDILTNLLLEEKLTIASINEKLNINSYKSPKDLSYWERITFSTILEVLDTSDEEFSTRLASSNLIIETIETKYDFRKVIHILKNLENKRLIEVFVPSSNDRSRASSDRQLVKYGLTHKGINLFVLNEEFWGKFFK
eukprot:TRINITY_DN3194_c1_g4_i1.p1 TRINITY_DN3194_c1_g4~~TRINITY_DN3194_c1_g4_i1.p1  ORF type:complete len:358 (-),score=110.14 TRINITY_DN3194_c1_g4_i1:203-1276(-)